MDFETVADKLVEAINARRNQLDLKDDKHGKLDVLTTNQKFNDWISSDPDNSARIALGAKCPLFRHALTDDLPSNDNATEIDIDGIEIGFVVGRLDEEAWERGKRGQF